MRPDESSQVKSIAYKSFKGLEKIFISQPKTALVAELEGQAVGAILYKIFKTKSHKIGYVDYAFIDPKAQGKGVGKTLYDETIKHLWGLECDYISAMVKDDNVASWGLFLKFGFQRISIFGILKDMGLVATLKLILGTQFPIALGMEYYLAAKNHEIKSDKSNSFKQILAYLITNLIFFLIAAFRFKNF
jgi:GNAT superfamily N-acetyltransferase